MNCVATNTEKTTTDCQTEPTLIGYKVEYNGWAEKPSEFGAYLGNLYFVGHKSYEADEYPYNADVGDYNNAEDFMEALREELPKDSIVEPVYMYSHGSDTISRAPFGCGWDSGWVGVFITTLKEVMSARGWTSMDEGKWETTKEEIDNSFAAWAAWVEGAIYSVYEIWQEGDEITSDRVATCYGDDELESLLDGEILHHLADQAKLKGDDKLSFLNLGRNKDSKTRNEVKALMETFGIKIPTVESVTLYKF
jgi:hypothetical protein